MYKLDDSAPHNLCSVPMQKAMWWLCGEETKSMEIDMVNGSGASHILTQQSSHHVRPVISFTLNYRSFPIFLCDDMVSALTACVSKWSEHGHFENISLFASITQVYNTSKGCYWLLIDFIPDKKALRPKTGWLSCLHGFQISPQHYRMLYSRKEQIENSSRVVKEWQDKLCVCVCTCN